LCLHAAINIVDDYFDKKNGVDTAESLYRSFVDTTEYTTREWHLKSFMVLIAISIIFGTYLVVMSDYVILAIGIASILVTYLYSGGPRPLASMAFGEFLSFFFFGPIACCGTYYIQLSNVRNLQLLNSISIGFLVSCVMLANNIRDAETDEKARKVTVPVRVGEKAAKSLYVVFVIAAYLISIALGNYLVLLSIPFAIAIIKKLLSPERETLQWVMESTSMLALVYSVLLCLGLISFFP
jgi:1,4-dihydroxy-2-naphthoate octaprenyltransferase